jgi:hypothetical protein
MEDLAWQYPAEPVERAAVRFCEAIAKWRGKPELETVSRHDFHFLLNPFMNEGINLEVQKEIKPNIWVW